MDTKIVCRLCLTEVQKNFESLDPHIGLLKTVSLDLDLTIINEPIICSECLYALRQSFDFKMTVLNNEDYLRTYVNCDNSCKLNLEEIVQRDVTVNGIKCEESVCRLCLKYSDGDSFVELDRINEDIFLNDMLQKCLPEIELNFTNHPLMCNDCMENLQKQFNFVIACVDNEEKIQSYIVANGINKTPIDTSELLKFIDNTDNNNYKEVNFIKLENVTDTSSEFALKEESEQIETDDVDIKSEENFDPDLDRDEASEQLQCQFCSYSTTRKVDLGRHILIIHQKDEADAFQCDKCEYKTYHKRNLSRHFKTHGDAARFKCEKCSKGFHSRQGLDGHILKKHEDLHHLIVSKTYRCAICNYRTINANRLSAHVSYNHAKDVVKNYTCNLCGHSVLEKSNLKKHMYIHSDLKPFVCKGCNKGFSEKRTLDSHIICKHSENSELTKTITNQIKHCEFCEYRTISTCNMKRHLMTHEK